MHPASNAALLEAMRAIATERDPDALLRVAAEACARVLGARLAWVVAQNEHRPIATQAFGFDPGPLDEAVFDSFLFRLERGVVTREETSGDLIGLEASTTFENLAVARLELDAVRCFVFVMNRPGTGFTVEDGELLAGLAAQIGGVRFVLDGSKATDLGGPSG